MFLSLENKRYSFFHEGFFDYAFARRFTGSSQTLLDLLLSGEQRLFRRAQVRQILLYLRDTEFDRYIGNLEETLSSADVRFHIKQVIFALLADLSEPVKEEWDVLSRFAGRDFSNSDNTTSLGDGAPSCLVSVGGFLGTGSAMAG